MERYIIEHGTLAIYKYLQTLYIYAVKFDKEECKELFDTLAQDLMISPSSFDYVWRFSREDLFNHICRFATEVDCFDRMFNVIFSSGQIDYKNLILTQKVSFSSVRDILRYKDTYGAVLNINYNYLILNGLVIFILVCKKLNAKPITILKACGKLLLQPYINAENLLQTGLGNQNKFLVYEDVNSEQMFLCHSFQGIAGNPAIVLPTVNYLDPIDLNLFLDENQDTFFIDKMEKTFFLKVHKETVQKYFPWLFSRLWISTPDSFLAMIDAELPDIDIFSTKTFLGLPCDKSLRKVIHNVMFDIHNTLGLDFFSENYLENRMGDGATYFFDASEFTDKKAILCQNYTLICFPVLLRFAKLYLMNTYGCTYETVRSFCTVKLNEIADLSEQLFIKKPTTKQIAELLVICSDDSMYYGDLFILVNMISRLLSNNVQQWFELTKHITGFTGATVHKVTDKGFVVVNISFNNLDTLGVAKKLRTTFVNYEDFYLINVEASDLGKYPLDVMLQGTSMSCTNTDLEDLPMTDGVTFEGYKVFYNPDDLCTYYFGKYGEYIYPLCNLPYNVSVNYDKREVYVANKIYTYEDSESDYILLNKQKSSSLTSLFN